MLLPPINTFFNDDIIPPICRPIHPIPLLSDIKPSQTTLKKEINPKEDNEMNKVTIVGVPQMVIPLSKFTEYEDNCLRCLVQQYGTKDWVIISKIIGNKTPRECKDRWEGYLNPKINNRSWTLEEDMLLAQKFGELGPKWKRIACFFNGRSDCSVRNRWNYLLKTIKKRNEGQQIEQ